VVPEIRRRVPGSCKIDCSIADQIQSDLLTWEKKVPPPKPAGSGICGFEQSNHRG
jgi:hypothetical protein